MMVPFLRYDSPMLLKCAMRARFLLLFVTSLLFAPLYASEYKTNILDIYAKIVPRLLFMSSTKKYLKEDIPLCIIRDKIDANSADLLIELLQKNYPKGILDMPLHVKVTDFTSYVTCRDSALIFLFNSTQENIAHVVTFAKKQIVVSYSEKVLDQGADISLFIGRKLKPYINVKHLNAKGINIEHTLLRVSKIYILK